MTVSSQMYREKWAAASGSGEWTSYSQAVSHSWLRSQTRKVPSCYVDLLNELISLYMCQWLSLYFTVYHTTCLGITRRKHRPHYVNYYLKCQTSRKVAICSFSWGITACGILGCVPHHFVAIYASCQKNKQYRPTIHTANHNNFFIHFRYLRLIRCTSDSKFNVASNRLF